ncbi:MAG: hypothetical protein DRP87_01270 [Spirochaetes bacterium]|nr:MAG: hypothetical protein DRP87_01270 [Spirochaetota bacterium]
MDEQDKSKLQSFISDLEGLKSRNPEESKFKDWKEKVEKKLEEVFGKNSEQLGRFKRIKFFDFSSRNRAKEAPLSEDEIKRYVQALDEAKRLLYNFL